MVTCEPGQGLTAAAISFVFMCPGAPPRFSPTPSRPDVVGWIVRVSSPITTLEGPMERASCL